MKNSIAVLAIAAVLSSCSGGNQAAIPEPPPPPPGTPPAVPAAPAAPVPAAPAGAPAAPVAPATAPEAKAEPATIPEAPAEKGAAAEKAAGGKREALEALLRSLPPDLSRASAENIRAVLAGIDEAERLLKEDDRERGTLPAGDRPHVEYILAYLLTISFERNIQETKSDPLSLSDRILKLLESGKAAFPPGSERGHARLSTEGHARLSRAIHEPDAARRSRDLAAAREAYLALLEGRPDWPERGAVHADIADAFVREGNHLDARKHLEDALKAEPGMPDAAYCEEKLFEALIGCGDLPGMEDLVLRRLAEYPARLDDPEVTDFDKDVIRRLLVTGQFWLGYTRLAMGDRDEARESFLRHISEVDAKEAEARAAGREIDPVARIFRDFRSRDLLRFIETRMGKRPEVDFDLGDGWCPGDRPTFASSRGKVLAVYSGAPRDPRAGLFLRGVDRVIRSERSRGLEGLILGARGSSPLEERVEALKKSVAAAGLAMAAGVDPHEGDPAIIRGIGAIVGPTASFLVFDREGRFAWYLPSPVTAEAGVAKAVIERLLGPKEPAK